MSEALVGLTIFAIVFPIFCGVLFGLLNSMSERIYRNNRWK